MSGGGHTNRRKIFGTFCEVCLFLVIGIFFMTIPPCIGAFVGSWLIPSARYQMQVISGLTFGVLSLISMIFSFILVYNEEAISQKLHRLRKKLELIKV
jgi:hypothetical protein